MIKNIHILAITAAVCFTIYSCTGSGVVAGDSSNNSSPNATTHGSANTIQGSSTETGAATQKANSSTSEIKLNTGSMAKPAQINR